MNVATGMGSSGPKQTASKTGRGGKRGTVKGHSRRTITKVQAPLKKGGKQAKAAKRNPQRDAVESAFQESDQRPYKDLAESKLFQGIETADDDATTQLLSQIYADLHEASFDALTTHTKDFTLASAGVPDSADTYLSSRLKYSVQSRLILHTQEMFSVIDDAYTSGADRPMIVFNAVNSIRNGPDHHRRVESMAWREERRRLRYRDFVASHGWMMLSILANSRAFRNACHAGDTNSWSDLIEAVKENARSMELFAKIRGLDWTTALINHPTLNSQPWLTNNIQSKYDLKPDRPHHRIVPSGLTVFPMRPFQVHEQSDITDNIYDPALFASKPRPANWPASLNYPEDNPTTSLTYYGACVLCGNSHFKACGCHPSTHRAVLRPLTELTQYPSKGIGIRALQPIREGALLGEYVGVLIPYNAEPVDQDPTYGMAFCPTPDSGVDCSIAIISSKRYGNWTRFINHSCAANTCYNNMPIGDRMRIMVVACRDIRFGEEITVDYGDQYWTEDILCKCGEAECKYGTLTAIAENTPEGRKRRLDEKAAGEREPKKRSTRR